jgi:hypothetical protein
MKRLFPLLLCLTLFSACKKEVVDVQPQTSIEKTAMALRNIVTNSSKLTVYIVRFNDRFVLDTIEINGGNIASLFAPSTDFIVVKGNFYSLNNLVEYTPVSSSGTYTSLYLYFG